MASLWVDLRSTNPLNPSRAFPLIKKMANAVESSTWRCPCLETRPRNLSGNSTAKPVWKLDRENRAAVISPNDRRPSRKGDMRRPPQPVSENEVEAPPFAPRGCRGHGDAVDHPSTSQGRKLHSIVRFEASPSRKGLLGDKKSRNPLPAIAWRQTDSLHHASRVRTLLAKKIVMM